MDAADHVDKNDVARGSFKCDKQYYLYKHYIRLHNLEPTVTKTFLCPTDDCENKLLNNDELMQHIVDVHGIPIETGTLLLSSMQDFHKWKSGIELDNQASYIQKKKSNMADGTIKDYFWCNISRNIVASKSKIYKYLIILLFRISS